MKEHKSSKRGVIQTEATRRNTETSFRDAGAMSGGRGLRAFLINRDVRPVESLGDIETLILRDAADATGTRDALPRRRTVLPGILG